MITDRLKSQEIVKEVDWVVQCRFKIKLLSIILYEEIYFVLKCSPRYAKHGLYISGMPPSWHRIIILQAFFSYTPKKNCYNMLYKSFRIEYMWHIMVIAHWLYMYNWNSWHSRPIFVILRAEYIVVKITMH